MDDPCPCGSGRAADDCCLPIIRREREAATAEELMRSRYTAFAMGDVDWIMDSHHPDTVHEIDREEVAEWSSSSQWLGLRIREAVGGGPEDDEGSVTFRARYKVQAQQVDHVERAHFTRHDGAWRFHSVIESEDRQEALVPVAPRATVGRNDPCPCGSGRKHKKCCGAAA